MVEHLCKMLKISAKDVLNYHPVDKFVLVKRTVYAPSVATTYVILKMCCLTSPKLNDSGYEPSKREIKKYFPFVVKASADYEYINDCYFQLIRQ